jgi:capsular exopolysaccharide synthesis family protein
VAEAFRSIRTAMMFSSLNGDTRVIQVVSSVSQEGKTLASVNLGIAVARIGKKVLVIDADLRKPRIHKIFQVPPSPGLSNLLAGQDGEPLEEYIRSYEGVSGLYYMTSGDIPPNPAELLSSDGMRELIETLKGQFDQIIIDTPPATIVTDGVIVSGLVQATIVIVRAFSTQTAMLAQTREVLTRAKAKIAGAVLNNVDMPRRGYYYHTYYYQQNRYYGEKETKSVFEKGKSR